MALEAAARVAMTSTSRTLLSATSASARAQRPIAASSLSYRNRQLHTSSKALAPQGYQQQPMGAAAPFPQYFGRPSRPSLPANTMVRFVPQQTAWIVERMGKFHKVLDPGFAFLWPFIDRIAYVKSLKENAVEIPSQSAITADNVTLDLDGVLYTRVFDAHKAS